MKKNIYWDIGVAPLTLDSFTRCKSDIKYLDYTALNICGIYSDHPAYNQTIRDQFNGILCGYTADEWYEKIEHLINEKQRREQIIYHANTDVTKSRLLEKNYKIWLSLFQKVLTS